MVPSSTDITMERITQRTGMYCRGINFVILQADFSDKIIQNISDGLQLITYIKQISCFLNTFVSIACM